jgi:hypothetical protein
MPDYFKLSLIITYMKYFSIFLCCIITSAAMAQLPNQKKLPNGWKLSPVGRSFPLGDLPLNIAVSKSQKLMAIDTAHRPKIRKNSSYRNHSQILVRAEIQC